MLQEMQQFPQGPGSKKKKIGIKKKRWFPLPWQILGFPSPGLRKLSWHTTEVFVHEVTFKAKLTPSRPSQGFSTKTVFSIVLTFITCQKEYEGP